jgi:hypothetical protein
MKKFTCIALLTLTPIAAHAADNYDTNTKTLTIQQVVVGNITYSNVVLKLKDFDVLKVDPNPSVGVVDEDFLFQFVSATLQGSQATVKVKITSQFKDITAMVGRNGSAIAQLTDDQGNVYSHDLVQIGNDSSSGHLNHPFAADIPTTVTFTYKNIALNATGIGLLNLVLVRIDPTPQVSYSYKLRNIPFQK